MGAGCSSSLPHHRIHVVGQKEKPGIIRPPIHRVVVSIAIDRRRFLIVQQSVDRHIFHPLIDVETLLDIGDVVGEEMAVSAV